jgi:hypothetical protein
MSDLVNKPDPVLQGGELPTFRFALETSEGKTLGGNCGKEAMVKQPPNSKFIAGVSMRLEPGVMRELHWHAPTGYGHSIENDSDGFGKGTAPSTAILARRPPGKKAPPGAGGAPRPRGNDPATSVRSRSVGSDYLSSGTCFSMRRGGCLLR